MKNTEKKSKSNKKLANINTKKFILTCIAIFLIIILFFLLYYFISNNIRNNNYELSLISFADKNKNTIFSIDKIVFFSSSDSKNKSSSKTNFTIENLYAYTDIALFINNNSDEDTLENTLKEVTINNINFTKSPTIRKSKIILQKLKFFCKQYY